MAAAAAKLPINRRRFTLSRIVGDYTTTMNLKSAALFALVGMILLTVLLIADFINLLLGVLRDIVPVVMLLRSLVYMLAGLGVTVFFWVFHRTQR